MGKKDYEKCQIATPIQYAKLMLKLARIELKILECNFLENSCGEGNILCEFVELFLNCATREKLSTIDIKKRLQENVIGIELDQDKSKKCLEKLDSIALKYNIKNIKWQILNEDFLTFKSDKRYDFIIGNPPYISYRNLTIENRKFCRENFLSCKRGKFDYCYAFIEKSLQLLSDDGKLVYLIPNSIFKNVFAKELRGLLLENIKAIYDNFPSKVFNNASISPSIFLYENNSKTKFLKYFDYTEDQHNPKNILKDNLKYKWVFDNSILNEENGIQQIRFGDAFIIANSIATLSNESYLIKEFQDLDSNYILVDKTYKIEKKLLRPAVSPNSLNRGKDFHIIFPYYYKNDKLCRYNDLEFENLFPFGKKYLDSKKEKLEKRDSDNSVKWFEYGRTQALANMNKEKLMISILVSKNIQIYELNENTIPYSGIYIVQKNTNYPLSKAKKILASKKFYKYIRLMGIKSEGSSKRITCNDVKKYKFKA